MAPGLTPNTGRMSQTETKRRVPAMKPEERCEMIVRALVDVFPHGAVTGR
jgi:hypothetical protein